MVQRGQVFTLKSGGEDRAIWAYRLRIGGLGSRRVQRGGFPSEQAATDVLDRALERLRREQGLAHTPTTVREVLTRLSGIMQLAAEHGYIGANPVRALRKVAAEPSDEVRVLAPVELEQLIAGLTGRDRVIVLLAGHLGLRPIEVLMATWRSLQGQTFTVGRSRTKRTAARTRVIRRPGRDRARAERVATRVRPSGRRRAEHRRDDAERAQALGRRHPPSDATLYALRHSHPRRCTMPGHGPEAARRLGHGPGLHVVSYAHVLDAISGERYADLDALVSAARAELRFPLGSPAAVER